MNDGVLKITNLSKRFSKSGDVLKDVSFQLNSGGCLGLVGPNGIGKTTLLRCISGSVIPESGSVAINNKKCTKFHLSIDSDKSIFPRLTAAENIRYFASLQGVSFCREKLVGIAQELNFVEYLDIQARKLSKGSKQKIQIILLYLTNYDVLLLDEPTLGLDAQSFEVLISVVKEKKKRNAYIILSSHDTEFCNGVCTSFFDLKLGCFYDQGVSNLDCLYRIEVGNINDLNATHDAFSTDKYQIVSDTTVLVNSNHLIDALKLIPVNGIKSIDIKGVLIDESKRLSNVI